MTLMKYRVLIEQDEDGAYTAEVPALPGCVTQGTTRAEALTHCMEAIAAYLESLQKHGAKEFLWRDRRPPHARIHRREIRRERRQRLVHKATDRPQRMIHAYPSFDIGRELDGHDWSP